MMMPLEPTGAAARHSLAILQKTIQIQNDIRLINLHQQQHILPHNGKVQYLDASCMYCKAFLGEEAGAALTMTEEGFQSNNNSDISTGVHDGSKITTIDSRSVNRVQNSTTATVVLPPLSPTSYSESHDDMAILNELERTVDIASKKGQVIVPRTWIGKRVKVVLLEG